MGIEIYIWGKFVGAIVKTEDGIAFQYDPSFTKSGLNLSPIYLPLNGKSVFFNEVEWKATGGIPGLLYDSLPDKFGSNLLSAYFANLGLTDKDIDVFAKLQYIGTRSMGALEFHPAAQIELATDAISMDEVEKISILATEGKNAFQTTTHDKNALLQILHLGTSAGGVRVKALLAINKKNGEIRSGQVQLGPAYEYFLIKIDGSNQHGLAEPSGFGRLEFTYYQMALDCNIKMSPSELYRETHFMTKRFDRDANGEKIHVHSLCGLLGLDYNLVGHHSYEQYFMAARRLGLAQDAMEEIFRRMVFNVLAHNCDDHTKNASFMMDKNGIWSLSPAFDLCYSYDSSNDWVSGHNLRINNKRKNIHYTDLMVVGEKFNIKKRKEIFQKTKLVIDQFQDYANRNQVKQSLIQEVETNRPKLDQFS